MRLYGTPHALFLGSRARVGGVAQRQREGDEPGSGRPLRLALEVCRWCTNRKEVGGRAKESGWERTVSRPRLARIAAGLMLSGLRIEPLANRCPTLFTISNHAVWQTCAALWKGCVRLYLIGVDTPLMTHPSSLLVILCVCRRVRYVLLEGVLRSVIAVIRNNVGCILLSGAHECLRIGPTFLEARRGTFFVTTTPCDLDMAQNDRQGNPRAVPCMQP